MPRWGSSSSCFFTGVQMAGDIIDVTGGFSLQPAYDPLSMTQSAMIGRLHYLLAITLLFTSGGHLLTGGGVRAAPTRRCRSGRRCPPTRWPGWWPPLCSMMFLAAVQIAGPLVAVLLLADLALALLSPGLRRP